MPHNHKKILAWCLHKTKRKGAKKSEKKRHCRSQPCKRSEKKAGTLQKKRKKSVTVAPNLAKKAKKKSGAQNKYPRWELNH